MAQKSSLEIAARALRSNLAVRRSSTVVTLTGRSSAWHGRESKKAQRPDHCACSLVGEDLLHPLNELVRRFLRIDTVLRDAGDRTTPDVFGIYDREFPVFGEGEEHNAFLNLLLDGGAVRVRAVRPKWRQRSLLGDRRPAAERALDVGLQVLLRQKEGQELLRSRLVFGVG